MSKINILVRTCGNPEISTSVQKLCHSKTEDGVVVPSSLLGGYTSRDNSGETEVTNEWKLITESEC